MSGGSGTLKFDASGGATGSYLGSIPFAWDFNNSIGNGSLSTYDLQLYLNNSLVLDENGALLATVSGSTSLDVSGLGSITSYEILLRTTALANSSGGTFSTTIPGGSTIDLAHQTAAQNTTPEPATVGLTASALAFLGSLAWWRRRKTS
jgi:hypothetical protein